MTPGLNGLFAPVGLPKPLLAQLQTLCHKAVESDAFGKAAANLQQMPAYLDAAQFKTRLDETYKANAALVPDLKLEWN